MPFNRSNRSTKSVNEPCLFVIFGATGDLNQRKLLPALHRLSQRGILTGSQILGVARSADMDDAAFRKLAREVSDADQNWCDQCVHYRSIGGGSEEAFQNLAVEIEKIEKEKNLKGNRVFYLALPPQSFAPTIAGVGRAGLNKSSGWTRIVVEKPFGRDL